MTAHGWAPLSHYVKGEANRPPNPCAERPIAKDCLRTLPVWVMEVTNYGIRQGAVVALAVAQLWRGGLCGLEPVFPPRSSFRDREDLVIYFQPAIAAVLAMMDVPDIILNAPHE